MLTRTVFLEYREDGVLTPAYSVTLSSDDNSYGIKELLTGTIIVPDGETTENTGTGQYAYTSSQFVDNRLYIISWKVVPNFGDPPKYAVQQIGPFSEDSNIRAVAESRGTFIRGQRTALMIRITDSDGMARDPELISTTITDTDNNVITTIIPQKVATGYYVVDWEISETQAVGKYVVTWSYTVDEEEKRELQEVVVSDNQTVGADTWYSQTINEFRMSLSYMLQSAQAIPVYREKGESSNKKTYRFTFPRWNQTPQVKIYVNDEITSSGLTVDYTNGTVIFDNTLTAYDRVTASYNFRWFKDEELDRYLSNAMAIWNFYPPAGRDNLITLLNSVRKQSYIPFVLYGAAIDALRAMMLSLQFQEPQLVFGGPEGANRMFGNLESLKKNYEESWNNGLKEKKNGPYVGLTRTVVTPEFTLPGGRSRWFRYLYSSGS